MTDTISMTITDNFDDVRVKDFTTTDLQCFQKRDDVYFDARNSLLSMNTDFRNMDWYYNYLKLNADFAKRHRAAYPTYLLDLGYIPIVYLPSCFTGFAIKMIGQLQSIELPVIQMRPTSFTQQFYESDSTDVWVSKLDVNKKFGIPIEDIRSADLARRIFQ